MTKKEQLQDSLQKLMGMTDLPASATTEITNIVSLVGDVNKEYDDALKESNEKVTALSKAYTDLAIHGKFASKEEPKDENKQQQGKTLEEIAQEIQKERAMKK